MTFHRHILKLSAIATAVMVMVLASNSVSTAASPERISIAYSKDSVPFHFTDKNGQPAGMIIDIWRLWSKKTGIAIDFQELSWNDTLTMVGSGAVDVHAGLFYSEKRDQFLDYGSAFTKTDTHYFTHVSLPSINTTAGLSPYRIGVIGGDYVEQYLKKTLSEGNVVPFSDYGTLMNALKAGALKVFAADTPTGLFHLKNSGLLSEFTFTSKKPLYRSDFFFAVKEGNQALIETINQGMALITDEERRDINRRWITSGEEKGDAVVISIDRAYAPLTFVNAFGRPSGFFVDMWRAWAQKTGRQIKFRTSDWAGTIEALRSGEVDIHSGLSFSEKRSEWIDFSTQIYETFTRIYHRIGDAQPESISGYNPYVVGTQVGSYQDAEFRKEYPFASIRLRTFDTNQELIDALIRGEVKAIVQEEVTMEADLDRLGLRSDITARPERLFPSTIHAGILKGNTKLLEQVNNGFTAIGREKLAEIERRWIPNPEDRFYLSDRGAIDLSPDEASWLDDHSEIYMGIMNAWPPINFVDEQGNPQGLGVDYLKALNKRLNGVLTIVPGPFKENFELVKNKKLDALMDITPKKEREPFFHFTKPYLTIPHVLVGRTDKSYFNSEKDLAGKTVALERGFYNVKYFQKSFPEVFIKEYASTSEALGAVSKGEADAYAGNRAVVTYLIEQELLANLSVQGRMEKPPVILTIGVRKDWTLLADILDRAFAAIPQKELRDINRKWLGEIKSMQASVGLTSKEMDWVRQHPVIRVAMDPDWAPVEFADDQGRFHGISMDYLKQLSGLLDIQFKVAEGLTWQEAIAAADKGELDMFSSMARTPERESLYYFTHPYLSMPINVFATDGVAYIGNLDALNGKQVAVVEGYATHEWLQIQHPEIKLVPVKSVPVALKMVATGQAYAFVGDVVTTSYYISKLRLNRIRVVGETPYKYAQSMAVRQDKPILAGILQKGLDTIRQSEREAIFNRWVSIQYEHGFDYSLLWKILAPTVLVIMLFFYWNQRLRKEVVQRKQAEAGLKADEERLETLLKLSQMKHVEEEQLMEYALEECVRLTSSEVGYLHFVNPDQKTLSLYTWSKNTHKYCTAEKSPHYPIESAGIWADAVRERRPVIHNDYPNHPDRKDLPDGHVPLQRHMSIPVMDGDNVVMVAGVGNKPHPYKDSDTRQISLFMQNMWGIIKEKRAEEIRTRYEFVVNSVQDPMSFINKNYVYEAVNTALSDIFQDAQGNLIGKNVADVWGLEVFETFIKPPLDRCFTGEVVSYEAPVDLGKSGYRHCQVTMYPYFDEKKKVTHAVVVTKDIEDRIQGEKAIKESEKRIKTIMDSINTGIIIIDPENRTIVDANPTAEQMIGLPKEKIIGNMCHRFICPREMNDCPIIDLDQMVDSADRIMLNADGKEIPILKTVVKVKLGGKPHLVESFVNLTERKQAEEKLRQNLAELEQFNLLTIDREEKMIELKSEINQLLIQLGEEEKYNIVE